VPRILTPKNPDNFLTNGIIAANTISLGKSDSEDNWREITPEEYGALNGGENDGR